MKKPLYIIITIIIIATTCLFGLTACDNSDVNKIRLIEVTHSVFYAPLYIAMNAGYFEDEGLTIDLSNGGGADKCMTALIAKQADIGLLGPEASIFTDTSSST